MNRNLLCACVLAILASSCTPGDPLVPEKNVVLLPVKNDPTINVRIWFKVGGQNDPEGKEGLTALTAQMLGDASTTANTYETIIEKLYPLAAWYSASSSMEMTVVSGRTHHDNIEDFYPLLRDAVLMPAFLEADLERLRSQSLNHLENTLRYASDEELGKAVLYDDVFAGTPYRKPAATVASLKSITLEDIRAHYAKHFTRDNLVIGLGGSYDESLLERLRADLARLPAGAPPEVAPPSPAPLSGFSVTIVEKEANATALSMGFPIDIVRGSKEWYALAVANSWLGEHRNSSSHLYQVIREERGLNYGDYSYIEHYPNGGARSKPPQNVSRRRHLFEIWIRPVPNPTRHFALRAALREFKRLVDDGLTEGEFTLTRDFLRKYVLHYAPTTMERLGYALDDRFYGIDGSHLERFRKAMDELTAADVNAAVRKYLQFGNMHIAVVTSDAGKFRDALVKDAPSPITYSTPKPPAVMQEDREIQTFPLKVDAGKVKIVKVEDLFAK
jgi:zinc protease